MRQFVHQVSLKNQSTWIKTASHVGPLTILDGDNITDEDLELAVQISARVLLGERTS